MKTLKMVLISVAISSFSYVLPMEKIVFVIPGAKFVHPNPQAPADESGKVVEFGGLIPSPAIRQAVNNGNLPALKDLVARGEDPCSYRGSSHNRETLLHCAAANGQAGIINYLVKTIGMDPNIKDALGATPAHYAASSNLRSKEGLAAKLLAITMLKALGADMAAKDRSGSSILNDALEEEMPADFIAALRELGVS